MDYSDFTNFLNERVRERNLSIKRLSELTGVSAKHLEGILSGDPKRLPSSPYLKGYLSKMGEVLDFNPAEAWDQMKKFSAEKSSGKMDELPKNRFSKKPFNKYIPAAVIVGVIALYAFVRFYAISGTPDVTVSYPSENMTVVDTNYISVTGKVSNGDELTVNGEKVDMQKNGDWQKTVSLNPGINPIEIKARKFLGREVRTVRQVVYQQPVQATTTAATTTQPAAR